MKKIFTLLFIASYVLNLNAKELNSKHLTEHSGLTNEWSIKPNDFPALAPAITLTSGPATANQAICMGNPIVNIYYATSGGVTGATITGLPAGVIGSYAANTFTISGTPTTAGVFTYTITTLGGSPAVTATGTITVSDRPNVTVNSPFVCQGGTAVVTATPGTSGTYSYTWTTPPGAPNPGNVASFSTSVLGTYSVIVTNISTNCSSASASGTVTSTPIPTATASPTSQTLCSGQSTGILLTGTTPNTTFSWTVNPSPGVTGAANGSGNIISQVLTTGSTTGTVTYTITPSANGCTGTPFSITVTVYPVPVVSVNTTQQSICTGSSTNITMSSNVSNATFYWNVVQSGGVTGGTAGTGASITDVLTASGTTIGQAVYTITPVVNSCPGTPVTVTLTVYPRPNITASPSSSTICSGETTNIIMSSNVPGTVCNWTVMTNGVYGATSGTGNQINQTLTTTGMSQGVVTYTITPIVNGCAGTPVNVTVTVNSTPEIFSSTSNIICSGDNSYITVTSNHPGTTYTWTVVQNGVTGAMAGSSNLTPLNINDILYNTGNTPGTAIYTITPDLNGCTGIPITVTLTVNPLPELRIQDGLICMDNSGNVLTPYVLDTNLSANDYLFEWHFNNNMNTVIAESSSYTATEAGVYTVTAFNMTSGCASTMSVNVIESSPLQSASVTYQEQSDGNYTVTVSTNGNENYYLYQIDGGASQTSNIFTDIAFGEHIINITDANGCTNVMEYVDLPKTDVEDLRVSPNPVIDLLTLSNDEIISRISVLNHVGQLIFKQEFDSNDVTIDLSSLNAGIYFIIIDSDQTKAVKIVKS